MLHDSHDADSELEVAHSSLISLASKAPALFESSNNAEKRMLIGFASGLRKLRWSEIDLESAEIRFMATRTKMDRAEVVPLSAASLAVLH